LNQLKYRFIFHLRMNETVPRKKGKVIDE